MTATRWFLMLYLLLPGVVEAQARVYKCVDGPHPVYQQTPCPGRAAWRWEIPAEQSLPRGAVAPAITPVKPSHRQRRAARAQGALITISADAAACDRARRQREQALLKRRRLDFVQRRQLDDAVHAACQ
ncbi:hypothetical protein [Stenotrophomonas beteli]|uniref:DUF4124 domain-containing protein n=1 Tax=Stenotrophomonas beteli TaxID=3384461 RepID=A0A0R0B3T5_9GAMM|nr:hypothetical protein [Stenotrophomonas maltophilia]KRG51932.1 hypothetical protein ARC23_06960 [Stenotrophomonas maltophilia]